MFDGATLLYEGASQVKDRVSKVLDSYKERGFDSIAVVCHQVVIKQFVDIKSEIGYCQTCIYEY